MIKNKNVARGVYILPNMFTAASLFCGFFGVIKASQGDIVACAVAILISAVLDGLDGKVARLTNTASEFGVQFDSLADLVAFGVAPAFMVWQWELHYYGRIGMAVSFLFVACVALRLARFNVAASVSASKKFFTGLPSPAGGCALAILVFFSAYLPRFVLAHLSTILLVVTTLVGLLMVSRVRYFAFKEYDFVSARPFQTLVSAVLIFILIIASPRFFGGVFCLIYLVSGPLYTYIYLPRTNRNLLKKMVQNNQDNKAENANP